MSNESITTIYLAAPYSVQNRYSPILADLPKTRDGGWDYADVG
jgi:hypothetical protein